ncbi:MAG: PQQ-dependent sugar dehydrogenase [Chthoniobacterales bacterium]
MTTRLWALVFALVLLLGIPGHAQTPPGITVDPQFKLQVFSDKIERPRTITARADGVVFVTSATKNQIFGLKDTTGTGVADQFWVVADNITGAHGIVSRGDDLYVGENGRILKIHLDKNAKEESRTVILDEKTLPSGGGHNTRMLAIGPDNRIYTGLGSSSNIGLDNKDALTLKRQKVWSYKLDGTDEQLFATGLRNTQKIDWNPKTSELFGTDHGSDNISPDPLINNDNPSCEFNHLIKGKDYGHPYVVTGADGKNAPRPEYAGYAETVEKLEKSLPAAFPLGGHMSPTGWIFYRGKTFPQEFRDSAILCLRGSWNSTVKHGYCVEALIFENGLPVKAKKLVDFLPPDKSREADRPVDASNYPDGSILFTGEIAGRVYKLSAAK